MWYGGSSPHHPFHESSGRGPRPGQTCCGQGSTRRRSRCTSQQGAESPSSPWSEPVDALLLIATVKALCLGKLMFQLSANVQVGDRLVAHEKRRWREPIPPSLA